MSATSEIRTKKVQAVMTWWRALYPDEASGRRGDAGALAALRRAESELEVFLVPASHDLLKTLRDSGVALTEAHLRRIAVAVAVICNCRTDAVGGKSFAALLGTSTEGDRPRLSRLRFQAMMAAMGSTDDAQQIRALRRALAQVKETPFNVRGFVDDLLRDFDRARIDWTFDYYGTDRKAPSVAAISKTEETPA